MNEASLTIEISCDTRELAVKVLAELKILILEKFDEGVFVDHALLTEDWEEWIRSTKKSQSDDRGTSK